jgi:tripartite ATP-independent transporter DctM subunit
MVGTLTAGFSAAVLIGTPIAFAIGLAAAVYIIWVEGLAPGVVVRTMFYSLDVSVFLAIPLFMVMGVLSEKSGVMEDVVRWLELLVGRLKGGIAYVNVLASMLFGGVSGSSVADIASMGAIEAKLMRAAGYDPAFGAGLTASSAVIGIIIPPSIGMIIYALAVGNISIGGLFLAGVLPGLVLGLVLIGHSALHVRKHASIRARPSSAPGVFLKEFVIRSRRALGFLVLPVFVLGSLIFGVATLQESAAIGALYILLYGVFVTRKIGMRTLFEALVWTAKMTSVVAMLVSTGALLGWILTRNDVTSTVANYMTGISSDPAVFLLISAGVLFVLGTLMDPVAMTIALAPLLAPVAQAYGISPFQFALVFILTVQMGMITPPIGTLIMLAALTHEVSYTRLCWTIWPFVVSGIVVILALVFFPALTTAIPGLFGVG